MFFLEDFGELKHNAGVEDSKRLLMKAEIQDLVTRIGKDVMQSAVLTEITYDMDKLSIINPFNDIDEYGEISFKLLPEMEDTIFSALHERGPLENFSLTLFSVKTRTLRTVSFLRDTSSGFTDR
jgi:hypothetical protein